MPERNIWWRAARTLRPGYENRDIRLPGERVTNRIDAPSGRRVLNALLPGSRGFLEATGRRFGRRCLCGSLAPVATFWSPHSPEKQKPAEWRAVLSGTKPGNSISGRTELPGKSDRSSARGPSEIVAGRARRDRRQDGCRDRHQDRLGAVEPRPRRDAGGHDVGARPAGKAAG